MDLRMATPEHARIAESEFDRMVRPLLRQSAHRMDPVALQTAVQNGLARLLPLRPHEADFIEALWERGEIHPELLTPAPEIQARIAAMPLLLWKARHVRSHRGL